jgi:hypothetical protein
MKRQAASLVMNNRQVAEYLSATCDEIGLYIL